jgi:ubiquinol-cytochrome c reductase cytochrome c1 subunit
VFGEHAAGGIAHVERQEIAAPDGAKPEDLAAQAQRFDRAVRDITTFLHYVGEPSALKREAVGLWVILFLAAFTLLAWLLKQEYWSDVH